MITLEQIMSFSKINLQEASKSLNKDDISQLVEWLSLKDNTIRYQVFLILQNRSLFFDDVYPYWDTFKSKLKSENSYQRSIGLILIANNVKWDTQNKIDDTIDEYLQLQNDEKPITIRQCIQSLGEIASCKPDLHDKIAFRLITLNLMSIKETMRKSILLDILKVLIVIRKEHRTDKIENFIQNALLGEILDKRSKKQIEALL